MKIRLTSDTKITAAVIIQGSARLLNGRLARFNFVGTKAFPVLLRSVMRTLLLKDTRHAGGRATGHENAATRTITRLRAPYVS